MCLKEKPVQNSILTFNDLCYLQKICVIIYFKRKQWNCMNLFYRISSKRSRCKSFLYILLARRTNNLKFFTCPYIFIYQGKYLANRNREYIIIFIQTFLFSSSFTVLIESIFLKNFLFYGI